MSKSTVEAASEEHQELVKALIKAPIGEGYTITHATDILPKYPARAEPPVVSCVTDVFKYTLHKHIIDTNETQTDEKQARTSNIHRGAVADYLKDEGFSR